jgi:pilus assembly protein CpaE
MRDALGTKTERRGPLKVLLVVEREERRVAVRAALAALGDPQLEIVEAEPGFVNGSNGAPAADVEMVVFDQEEEAPLNRLRSRAARFPHPALFALLPERSPSLMRRVLRAGADEVLFLPLDPGEAIRALLKVSEARRRNERGGGGVVCSLTSTVGGAGVTTLTANLALALRHSLDKRVAALDLDLQQGGLGVFLNLEPEHTIADLADQAKKIDSIQLELSLTKHPSGIYLVAAPLRIEEAELVTERVVGSVIELMRQLFDYVVVDCGSHIDELAIAAWERSDNLFYVVEQSLPSVRSALRFLELYRRLKVTVEPQFVLNRFTAQHSISDEQVSHTLAQPAYARIPSDESDLERVQWGARDLWQVAPRSGLVQGFEQFARRVASGGAEDAPHRSGLLSRLLATIARN